MFILINFISFLQETPYFRIRFQEISRNIESFGKIAIEPRTHYDPEPVWHWKDDGNCHRGIQQHPSGKTKFDFLFNVRYSAADVQNGVKICR